MAPYKTKVGFKDSDGSLGALTKQFSETVLRKLRHGTACNPCVRLDRSGLVVLDVDEGLTSVEHAKRWAKEHGLPYTYMVVSGRKGKWIGVHFYFKGYRTLPDVYAKIQGKDGVEHAPVTFGDGVYGDLKHHGHVVVEGGLHKSGAFYKSPNPDTPVAVLPNILRDYKYTPKKQYPNLDKDGTPATAGIVVDGVLKLGDIDGNFVVEKKRNKFFCHEAGIMRGMGLTPDLIYANLKQECLQFGWAGEQYSKDQDETLRRIANGVGNKPIYRRLGTEWTTALSDRPSTDGIMVVYPGLSRAAPVTVLARRLIELFPVGHEPITVGNILYLYPEFQLYSRLTIRNAMRLAGFMKIGEGSGKHITWQRMEAGNTLYSTDKEYNKHKQ